MATLIEGHGGKVTYELTSSKTVGAVSGAYPSPLGSVVIYYRAVIGPGSGDVLTWTFPVADKANARQVPRSVWNSFISGDVSSTH